jgi:hypothetical protein
VVSSIDRTLIAVSIVYMAFENIVGTTAPTLDDGLRIRPGHGFGFRSPRNSSLPDPTRQPLAVVQYRAELGQLLVLILLIRRCKHCSGSWLRG